jgi:hypothetical protein
MTDIIQQSISNYKEVVANSLERLRVIHSKYACENPELLRQYYDKIRVIIDKKTIEINQKKDYINECINNLEKCKNSLVEMEKVIEEISITSNTGMVGTLHGLCKDLIKQNNIPMDEIEETVFNYPYDEKNETKKYK